MTVEDRAASELLVEARHVRRATRLVEQPRAIG